MKRTRVIIACAAALALTAGYLAFENEALMLTQYDFASSKVPESFDGFKICHLSDIHVKRAGRNYTRLVNMVSEQEPDIIVISGDLVDSRDSDVASAVSLVGLLREIAPVCYVTGNHEERLPTDVYLDVIGQLSGIGARVLNETAEQIERGGEYINIIGLFDREEFSAETLKGLIKEDGLNILLNHRPQFAPDYAEAGADLTFCGHAHGGQVRIPFVGGAIAPDQYFFPEFYEGMHWYDGRATVISRGIGNSLMSFRVNNRPEVIILTLKAE